MSAARAEAQLAAVLLVELLAVLAEDDGEDERPRGSEEPARESVPCGS